MKEEFIFKELEKEEHEALVTKNEVSLPQNYFYGEWQRLLGKTVWRYKIEADQELVGFFQVIKYQMSFCKNYLYIPHGPIFLKKVSDTFFVEFKKFTEELCRKENAIFLRFDPYFIADRLGHMVSALVKKKNMTDNLVCTGQETRCPSLSAFGRYFFRAPNFLYDGGFQPKYEWVLDLSQSEEELLSGMKKVNRYTVRQAEKFGVEVEVVDKNLSQYLDKFYELIEATAERDEFSHNTKEYYKNIFGKCEEMGNGFLTVARYKGEIMLINFFVTYRNSAFFLFSGSEGENRKIGYTYLAQWTAIKHSKKLGLKKYNFGAVIVDDNKYSGYKRWQGFSDFKKRFGGDLVEYSDFYDVVYSKFWYILYISRKIIALCKKKIFG